MRSIITFFSILALCRAKPRPWSNGAPRPSLMKGGEQYISGGTDALPGEFPWQLSIQRLTSTWTHCFGASLLSANYGLTAAHAIYGWDVTNVKVIAGLHQVSNYTGTKGVPISSYTLHENYEPGAQNYHDDIAILNFAAPFRPTIGGNIQPATLPPDDGNNYVGYTCVITGWGSTGLPQSGVLQKASIPVISSSGCSVPGAITNSQICVYDPDQNVGVCSGDNGGPLNCPDGDVTLVAGVGSWIYFEEPSDCMYPYPSVYTRVSSYLDWIAANIP